MKVIDHFLYTDDGQQVPFKRSPNIERGIQPAYLVIHYTAGPSVAAAVATLTNPKANVSAHLVIGRDGSITQLVPFNMIAWHAGASSWEGLNGLNKYSFGFELDNNGRLNRKDNQWASIFGHVIPDDEVLVANHKNGKGPYGWQTYPEAQLTAAIEASQALFLEYKLLDVVGHDDIAPLRKYDPGPAFPMESFRARVIGRAEIAPPMYETTGNVYIRSGPGSQFKTLIRKPLPKGTHLEKLDFQGNWIQVSVLDVVDGVMDLEGWVYSRYIKRVLI
jgi:N-acetylmuramoyl-L-alanine amidase